MSDPSIDLGPTSSYSDPFYDRLDAISRFIRSSWPLVTVAIILVVAGVFTIAWMLQRHPEAGSAARYIAAREVQDEAKRSAAFAAVAADASLTPGFRARANVELVQQRLMAGDLPGATTAATAALELAQKADDNEIKVIAQLSRAAVHFQAGELDAAGAAYGKGKSAAGSRLPVLQLEATLGVARVAAAQGRLSDAISELEPLTVRADAGAEQQLALAKVLYWDLKRRAATPVAAAPASATAASAPAPATSAAH